MMRAQTDELENCANSDEDESFTFKDPVPKVQQRGVLINRFL